jgi:hypothetical protein
MNKFETGFAVPPFGDLLPNGNFFRGYCRVRVATTYWKSALGQARLQVRCCAALAA